MKKDITEIIDDIIHKKPRDKKSLFILTPNNFIDLLNSGKVDSYHLNSPPKKLGLYEHNLVYRGYMFKTTSGKKITEIHYDSDTGRLVL